jgi:hypothetical protein
MITHEGAYQARRHVSFAHGTLGSSGQLALVEISGRIVLFVE